MITQRRMLITAGPTHEPIDSVRYLANRSSGRLGVALSGAAVQAGWSVELLLGPVDLPVPTGVAVERFTTAGELGSLLDQHFPTCQVLIMAAAVADYRPLERPDSKLPRQSQPLVLQLQPTPDLVARCAAGRQPGQRIIGFALEEERTLQERARAKLQRKKLDAIVANPLSTLGSEGIDATLMFADGRILQPGPMTKIAFATWLIGQIDRLGDGVSRL